MCLVGVKCLSNYLSLIIPILSQSKVSLDLLESDYFECDDYRYKSFLNFIWEQESWKYGLGHIGCVLIFLDAEKIHYVKKKSNFRAV